MAEETDTQGQPNPPDATIRLAGILMGAFGVVGYLFWALSGGLVREGAWIGVDFHVYYEAAHVLRRGADIYTSGISPPYVYPPLLAALVVPLSLLPVDAATIFWKLSQHVYLLVSGVLLLSMLPARVRPLVGGILLLGLLTVPLQDEIQVGESNSLILLLVVGALWLVSRSPGTDANWFTISAGLLLGLAASIKVLPVLLIAYFWWRGPRITAAVATGGFLVLQVVMFILTPSTADYWFTQFPGLFGQAFPYLDNQSINAFFSRAVTPPSDPTTISTQITGSGEASSILIWIANILVVLAATAVLWRSGTPTSADRHARSIRLLLEAGLVLLTIHMVSGSTWLHHLVDLVVPVSGLLGVWWLSHSGERGTASSGPRTLVLALGLGAALGLLLHRPGDWVTAANALVPLNSFLALLASGAGLWVVLGLWIGVSVELLLLRSGSGSV